MNWWNPFSWFVSRRAGNSAPSDTSPATAPSTPSAPSLRRFTVGSMTNRLNAAHWQNAHGESVNNDLAEKLPWLIARCELEYSINSDFQGVVDTYAQDVAGPYGPLLQIRSDNEQFNEVVEQNWRRIFRRPRPGHRHMTGSQNMQQWVRSLCLTGSYINLFREYTRRNAVDFGWQTLHVRRLLEAQNQFTNQQNVAFGIEYDTEGDPVRYHFETPTRYGPWTTGSGSTTPVSAEMVQHVFLEVEPEQLIGYPWMTQSLESAGQLYEYDQAEMQAAKLHAQIAVGLENTAPDAIVDPVDITAPLCYEPGMVNVAPRGWKWSNHQATQPNPNSLAFRHDKLAGLGRGLHMPLLIVMMRVDQASFSSAQFAGELYKTAIRNTQALIQQTTLDELLELMVVELAIAGLVDVPEIWEPAWTFNVPPHANIEKFVKSLRSLVEDGIIAPQHASASVGLDYDEVVEMRRRAAELLDENDLPPAPTNSSGGTSGGTPDEPPADEDAEETVLTNAESD